MNPSAATVMLGLARGLPLVRVRENGADWLLAEVRPFIEQGVSA